MNVVKTYFYSFCYINCHCSLNVLVLFYFSILLKVLLFLFLVYVLGLVHVYFCYLGLCLSINFIFIPGEEEGNVDLLILIVSAPVNTEKRAAVRETWLSHRSGHWAWKKRSINVVALLLLHRVFFKTLPVRAFNK